MMGDGGDDDRFEWVLQVANVEEATQNKIE